MIATLLFLAQASAPQNAEVWEPRYSWGCTVSDGKNKPFVVNGIIAQRNEPGHPNEHARFQRALRVVRDDSGAFTGLQARPPMFVVHPKAYLAFFADRNGKSGAGTRSIILTKDGDNRPVSIELVGPGGSDVKPYAKGRCLSKVLSAEIVQ